MKNLLKRAHFALYILLMCVFTLSVRGQSVTYGEYNIYIGKNVSKHSIKGNYNIIIVDSADYRLQNIDESYLFIVDYDCEFLKRNPEIRGYLKAINKYGFVSGGIYEIEANRKEIWKDVSNMVLNAR